jgi:two-component system chemotaxis sensor kinase CheA
MSKTKTKPRAKRKPKSKAKRKSGASKALEEFLSEAQEFAESLSRNLLAMDKALKSGEPDPDLVNDVFRGWHTLKGLAGTFGVESLSRLAHHEENLLDDIRLGRVELTPAVLDTLLGSVETVMLILATVGEAGELTAADGLAEVDKLIRILEGGDGETGGGPGSPGAGLDGSPAAATEIVPGEVLEVLTEYEEHRLRTNLERGRPLYRVRTSFELQAIDTELEAIKQRLKPVGEIITYLPSTEGDDPDLLDIDVLLALKSSYDELTAALAGQNVQVELLAQDQAGGREPKPTLPPPPPAEVRAAGPGDEGVYETAPGLAAPVELAPEAEVGQALSLRSVSQTVRVDIGKLDRLMNVVGELNIIRAAISKVSDELRSLVGRRELAIELHRVNRGFERRLAELREGILEVRMVPVGQMFDRLARMTRKISRDLAKEVHFVVSGADTEVDKLIIEELSDPLMHIIRNAIDHGIEAREDRVAAGKPEVGTVALTAYQKGNHVLFEVEDDGGGIDGERIIEVAVARGQLSLEQAELMSQREILNLIFLPGVTTTTEATVLSGRGVGMDVVKTNIGALGGVIEVQSELGIGTKFTITMPVTMAIIPALLVIVDDLTYAIPLNTVAEALFISESDVRSVAGAETMTLREQTLPLCRLDRFFGLEREGPWPEGSCVVVAALGQRRLGLVVDALIGQQDVVIKPLGQSLDEARCFAGATDIGDQRLSLVLDTAAAIEEFFSAGDGGERRAATSE